MANKKQKTIKRSTGDWMYCSFQAHPEEVAEWRELAVTADRSLSWWIRTALNKAVASVRGNSNEATIEEKPVETVSADRARTDLEG